MPIIQISKIQMRRGAAADLPNPSLDDGEFGFADDAGRLFIGQTSPSNGQPNYNRSGFPYENVEVLTENSPLGELVGPVINDNQGGYYVSTPLSIVGAFTFPPAYPLQVLDITDSPQDFYVDVTGNAGNAHIQYFIYDTSSNAIRNGTLTVLWNTTMTGEPLLTDQAEVPAADVQRLPVDGDTDWFSRQPAHCVAVHEYE